MPSQRQTVGHRDFKAICDACEPPCEGATDEQRKIDYCNDLQNLCELMVDACIKRRAVGSGIDDWGFVETIQSVKRALGEMMQGVRG